MPVKGDFAVVSLSEWHSTQPMLLKSAWPFAADGVNGTGTGTALRRMKAAKFTCREEIWLAKSPAPGPGGMMRWVVSSGVTLNTHPRMALRSLENTSLAMPCSTLEASPEKISRDLFCAFQPKRVIVPSLPLVLKRPAIPRAALAAAFAARLACRLRSGVFSTKPRPKVGVGIRNTTLLLASCAGKFSCGKPQPGASKRPRMEYKLCTPPSNPPAVFMMKRASRTGPLGKMKGGTALVAPSSVASATCGLGTGLTGLLNPGLLPPTAGSAWHCAQLLPLNPGPRPFPSSPAIVPLTESTSENTSRASLKLA